MKEERPQTLSIKMDLSVIGISLRDEAVRFSDDFHPFRA
jgi:hypothetical protein